MERTTPVGPAKGARMACVALAAAMAVGAMSVPAARGAVELTPQQKQQLEQDRQAARLLNDAKQAYEQKNYPASVQRYREFVNQFPKRPEATAARYGLTMALVETPDAKDWNAMATELAPVVAADGVPDKTRALYWLGVALRVTGEQQLEAAKANPAAKEPIAKATARIEEGAGHLAKAAAGLSALSANVKIAPDAKELPAAIELAARARVEGAEALLKVNKAKEAADLVAPFAADATLAKSTSYGNGLIALGQARLALGDYAGATAALARLAPFEQVGVGLHARYLLARISEETGQRPEAVVQYEPIGKLYVAQRPKAEQELQQKQVALRNRPVDQMRLEQMVRGVPEYVLMAAYRAAELEYEYGRVGEALTKYQAFAQAAPKHELTPLAQLRAGACMVQLRQPESPRLLQPLVEHKELGDQATWWMARHVRATADPNNLAAQKQQLTQAVQAFASAAQKAAAIGKTDPAAAARRGDILVDQAETLVQLKEHKAAAALFDEVSKDAANVERAEAAHEKLAMCLNKAGDFAASDAACAAFLAKYPQSMLRPSVLFWQAENAYRQGVELAKKPETAGQAKELSAKAGQQYQAVLDKFPEFPQASAARFGVGMALYRQGEWDKAVKQFERIADSDRNGELLPAAYYQADCLVRTMPESADDALSAARLSGQLDQASKHLQTFIGGATDDRPELPDAMLKLADCYQRNAAILADKQERTRILASARETYDKLLQKFPKHPTFAAAVMERARCIAAAGDPGGAINELNRFRGEATLVQSAVAPLALTRMSELMVRHGRAAEAVPVIDKARKDFEAALAKDAERAGWVAGLRYQHGAALKETGKAKEALAIFESIVKEFAERPEAAEASLAAIQVRKDDAVAKLKAAGQAVAAAPADKPVDAKLLEAQAEAAKGLSEIAAAFGQHAERIAEKAEGSDVHARTLRDAATAWRAVAETEIDAARRAKGPQAGTGNGAPRPAAARLTGIPVTPAEQKAREFYAKALEVAPDAPGNDALRLELADMHFDRGEADPAIQLLTAAIDAKPPAEQLARLRVKLGEAYLLKNDANNAMAQATLVLADSASPSRAAGYLLKGKTHIVQKSWGEATSVLTRFRGGGDKYVNAGPVTEEGLARLAEAYAAQNAWAECQATYEHLLQRFGNGRYAAEARYGVGWALVELKQSARAKDALQRVVKDHPGTEWAQQAQQKLQAIP